MASCCQPPAQGVFQTSSGRLRHGSWPIWASCCAKIPFPTAPAHPTTLNALVGSCLPLPLVPQGLVPHCPPKALISAAFAATRHPLLQMQMQPTPARPLTHVSQQPTPMGCRQVQSRQLVLSHDSPRENCFPSYSQGAAKETVVMRTHGSVLRTTGSLLDSPVPQTGAEVS